MEPPLSAMIVAVFIQQNRPTFHNAGRQNQHVSTNVSIFVFPFVWPQAEPLLVIFLPLFAFFYGFTVPLFFFLDQSL